MASNADLQDFKHVTVPLLRARAQKLTRQGVRDLNAIDGRGYNGNRTVSCPHYTDVHHPTRREGDLYVCITCGEERFTKADRRG